MDAEDQMSEENKARIASLPTRPKRGSRFEVTYDFSGLADEIDEVLVVIHYEPHSAGAAASLTVRRPSLDHRGTGVAKAPLEAESALIVDKSAHSTDCAVFFD